MKSRLSIALAILCTFVLHTSLMAENWPGWRGPRGDGTSLEKGIATTWDGKSGKNVAWKVALPGVGHASPIIWGDRVFTISTVEKPKGTNSPRILLSLDAKTGKIHWQKTVFEGPLETRHNLNSRASSTPATDGEHVFVSFLKVHGRTVPAPNVGTPRPITPGIVLVVAYDFDGKEKWRTEVGDFVSAHGFCTCPVVYKDLVIVNGDHDGDAYIAALDRASGKIRWKVPRENKTRSYVTPIIRDIDGRTQMVLSGSKSVASFDPITGKRHWVIDGPTEQFVASLVYDGKLLFVTGGYPERHILAIRPDGKGNVTDSHVAWRTNRGAAYVPSPIVEGKYFLVVSDRGIASCFEAANGERLWMERLKGGHSASTISAGGLVYFISDKGETTIVRPGPKFDVVARNQLGERCSASPAISGGRLYIRGHQHLFAIEDR